MFTSCWMHVVHLKIAGSQHWKGFYCIPILLSHWQLTQCLEVFLKRTNITLCYQFCILRNRIIVYSNLHLKHFTCFSFLQLLLNPKWAGGSIYLQKQSEQSSSAWTRARALFISIKTVAFQEQPIEEGKGESFSLARISRTHSGSASQDSRLFSEV